MKPNFVVVGLGNPGARYAWTRHNVGFLALDVLAQDFGTKFESIDSFKAEKSEVTFQKQSLLLLKPQTFMNLSGESLQRLYQKYNHFREVPLVVLHDELDLPFGTVRVKLGGGDAGHNGLKSIRATLGHGDFYRIRLGIGRPADARIEIADWVLQSFQKSDEETLLQLCSKGLSVLEALTTQGLVAAQNAQNG